MIAPFRWMVTLAILLSSVSFCQAAITVYTLGELHDDGVLVGSVSVDSNDSLADAQSLIGLYNANTGSWSDAPGPILNAITAEVDKLEMSGSSGSFEDGVLSLSDFTFYTWDGSMFVATSDLTQPILGFEYSGSADIDYYAVKADASQAGWSLWSFQPGVINKAYFDPDGDLDTLFDAPQFDISHITFYADGIPDEGPLVPEPASIVAWLLGAGGLGLILRRRMSKVAA